MSNDSLIWPYYCIKFTRLSTFGEIKKAVSEKYNLVYTETGVPAPKMPTELDVSERSVRRIMKNDLWLLSYKKVTKPLISDDQNIKRKQFVNWVQTYFRQEETTRTLFSDEKFFDIDGVCNSHNNRAWVVDRADAYKKGGIKHKLKFPQRVMVWLGTCSKGVTPLMTLDEGIVNHTVYIEIVPPVTFEM